MTNSFNPSQAKAINQTNGRLLVLAGAGSGKTRVITYRIAHLIKNSTPPSSILGLTFTNKAASEMKKRVSAIVGVKKTKELTLCTFHSFCLRILRKNIDKLGYTRNFSIYDEKDIYRILVHLTKDILKMEKDLPSLSEAFSIITMAKNKNLTADALPPTGSKWLDNFTKELYERLNTVLRAYNAVDFDSLLTLTSELLQKDKDILQHYQDKYKYIMIDEYQDTNPIQYNIAELIANKHNNICVVGDDDQAIYSWRGAEVKHILEFKADLIIKLEQNYRSTPTILKAANSVIKNNNLRHDKVLWSDLKDEEKIELFHAPTETDEAKSVISKVLLYKEKLNLKFSDFAILYRSNSLSRNIELALIDTPWQKENKWIRGIPYEIYGGLEFSQRSEIKDILAYLRIIANEKDTEALLRIINIPRRGISDKTLDVLTTFQRKHKIALYQLLKDIANNKYQELSIQSRPLKGIREIVDIIESAKLKFKSNLSNSLKWLIEKINYKQAIDEETKNEKLKTIKWENVQECVNTISQYEEETKDKASLVDFISTTQLLKENISNKTKTQDKLNLMTFHSSKGLEFPVCFLIGLEDHILPHEKSLLQTGIEEERRLLYVAITRAKKHLVLSMSRSRKRFGKTSPSSPSRFLFEIPKDLLQVTSWKVFN